MGFGGGGKPGATKNEINVTPLVDVVLVLLIIFLVTMPITMRTVTLEVPRKAEDFEDPTSAAKPIIICRGLNQIEFDTGTGAVEKFGASELPGKLGPLLQQKSGEKVVFVDFHPEADWTAVLDTMDLVRSLADKGDNYNTIKIALKKRDNDGNGVDDFDACGCPSQTGGKCDPEPAVVQ